jgi:2-oxoglutarate dehydrogenase complex dehydrogenase (E1) component-like enzyme
MSIGSLNPLSNIYLQSILTSAIQSTGLTTNSANNSLSTSAASSISRAPDKSQLSPFAQLMSDLQKLQQTDPAKYQQVTQQIATNLQTAAQTATAAGDTTKASQLTKLATDFSDASQSGQLPNMQDLAQAIGRHHHHHHVEAASADSANTPSTSLTSSASQMLSQLLAAYQTNGTQNAATDPLGIIMSTLSSAGISGTQN